MKGCQTWINLGKPSPTPDNSSSDKRTYTDNCLVFLQTQRLTLIADTLSFERLRAMAANRRRLPRITIEACRAYSPNQCALSSIRLKYNASVVSSGVMLFKSSYRLKVSLYVGIQSVKSSEHFREFCIAPIVLKHATNVFCVIKKSNEKYKDNRPYIEKCLGLF